MGKPTFFVEMGTQTHSVRHGGREILRFTADLPAGDTAAARHARALAKTLYEYVCAVSAPDAAAQLERAVREGRGYAFVPHRCRVTVKTYPVRRLFCVEIAFSHTRGDEILSRRALVTYWSADGAWQRKRPLFFGAAHAVKAGKTAEKKETL